MKDIQLLHPLLKPKAEELVKLCAHVGHPIIITQTLRSKAEQDAIYAQGRTTPGKVVSNCKYPDSPHCWGLAFDVARWIDRDGDRKVDQGEIDWSTPEYQIIGRLGKSIGLVWGGEWKNFPDAPHFELPGTVVSKLIKVYKTPQQYIAAWPKGAK